MKFRSCYKYDKRTRRLSLIETVLVVILCALIFLIVDSEYVRAWLFLILVAIAALYVLSIPRCISVDVDNLEIRCIVEVTRIEVRDIVSIRKVDRKEYKRRLILVLGSYGFFGYYGYYFNFRNWETVKVYITELSNLVEIEDIYEQKYLVSCRESDKLLEVVMQSKLKHAGEDEDE